MDTSLGEDSYCVLIAIDRSEEAKKALQFYLDTLHQPSVKLLLMHCLEPTGTGIAGDFMSMESDLNIAGYEVWLDMVQKEKESANELEEEFKTLLKDRKVNFSFVCESASNVGDAIVKTAEGKNARYIVMGTRGQGTLRRTIFGSVSDYVLHHSDRPVFVYRDHH